MGKLAKSEDYSELLVSLKDRIRSAQCEALKAANKALIALYWDIGKLIVGRQEKYGWGDSIVENIAADFRKGFPWLSGYSKDNLVIFEERTY